MADCFNSGPETPEVPTASEELGEVIPLIKFTGGDLQKIVWHDLRHRVLDTDDPTPEHTLEATLIALGIVAEPEEGQTSTAHRSIIRASVIFDSRYADQDDPDTILLEPIQSLMQRTRHYDDSPLLVTLKKLRDEIIEHYPQVNEAQYYRRMISRAQYMARILLLGGHEF